MTQKKFQCLCTQLPTLKSERSFLSLSHINKVTWKDTVPDVEQFPAHYTVSVQSEEKHPDRNDWLAMANKADVQRPALWEERVVKRESAAQFESRCLIFIQNGVKSSVEQSPAVCGRHCWESNINNSKTRCVVWQISDRRV